MDELLAEVDRLVRSTPGIEVLADNRSEKGRKPGEDPFGQPPVELTPEDTPESVQKKVQAIEGQTLVKAIQIFMDEKTCK